MTRSLARTTSLAAIAIVASRCAAPALDTSDGSPDAAPTVEPVIDASELDVPLPSCGDTRCAEPVSGGPLGQAACCLPSGACGLKATALGSDCLPRAPAAGVDLSCPGGIFAGGVTLQGCCGANGHCGLVDPNSELGCVDSAADAALCDYHANNDCTSIVELPCDGPEDCAPGNVCCGRTQRDHYDLFGCFLSCDGIVDGQDGVWIEICHPGAPCLNPRFTCEASALLPGFLARCHDRGTPVLPDGGGLSLDASIDGDAGDAPVARDASTAADASVPPPPPGIACGSTNCAASEKCCLRRHVGASSGAASIDPYCTKADGFCACSPAVDP